MRRLAGLCVVPLVWFLLLGVSGCGKSNIFAWAHSSGSDSSPAALSSDAYTALQGKDYGKALDYYQKILQSDPANSEAIYGAAAAELANAGLDLGSLVANLVNQQQAPSAHHLAPAIAVAARTIPPPDNNSMLPSTILANIDAINTAVNNVLSDNRLRKIIKGQADGKISPENADVNLNIAFCLIVRAAITAYKSNNITVNSDYTVTVTSPDNATAESIGRDVISAYYRLRSVRDSLKLGDSSAVGNIEGDANKLLDDLRRATGINLSLQDYYYLGLI